MLKRTATSWILAVALMISAGSAMAMPSCGVMTGPGLSAAMVGSCCPKVCHCAIKAAPPVSFPAALASRAADGIPTLLIGLTLLVPTGPLFTGGPLALPSSSHSPPNESLLDLYSVYRI